VLGHLWKQSQNYCPSIHPSSFSNNNCRTWIRTKEAVPLSSFSNNNCRTWILTKEAVPLSSFSNNNCRTWIRTKEAGTLKSNTADRQKVYLLIMSMQRDSMHNGTKLKDYTSPFKRLFLHKKQNKKTRQDGFDFLLSGNYHWNESRVITNEIY
jgi:hypothetical protein